MTTWHTYYVGAYQFGFGHDRRAEGTICLSQVKQTARGKFRKRQVNVNGRFSEETTPEPITEDEGRELMRRAAVSGKGVTR